MWLYHSQFINVLWLCSTLTSPVTSKKEYKNTEIFLKTSAVLFKFNSYFPDIPHHLWRYRIQPRTPPFTSNSDRQERQRPHPWSRHHVEEPTTAFRIRQDFYYSLFSDHPSNSSLYHASRLFIRLKYDVWKRTHDLGISRKRKTHRGRKGRRSSNNIQTCRPYQL